MSTTTTCPTETQAVQDLRKLRVHLNKDAEPTFQVSLEHGDWSCWRTVTVTDETIDILDLVRRIERLEVDVGQPDRPEGDIIYTEDGRSFIVGNWTTEDSFNLSKNSITFDFGDPDSKGRSEELFASEIEGMRVEIETPDELEERLEAKYKRK